MEENRTEALKSHVFNAVQGALTTQLSLDAALVAPESRLQDLGADSLDLAELMIELEERLNLRIMISDALALQTVGDVVELATQLLEQERS